VQDKARRVNNMFSAIAPTYDLNNRLHSMGMDQHWRSVAVKMANVNPTDTIIDVACGTGDLTAKFYNRVWYTKQPGHRQMVYPNAGQVFGVDFTFEMLSIASGKGTPFKASLPTWQAWQEEAKHRIGYVQGDALNLPFLDRSADIVSIAFGIRNVSDWGAAIDEFARVLKPGGRLIILEFSLPTNPFMRALYNFYFRKIMPITATLISGDKSGAYKYLPESVNTFITRQAMQDRMKQAGFTDIVARPMTFGICVCYKGVRS
jgi:demethylmenaquinone methyltransferase / 2-methoxy-6-polyprenyl-1,4-benzoquinol methylase